MNEGGKILEFTGVKEKDPVEKTGPRIIEINRSDGKSPRGLVVLAICKLEGDEISFDGDEAFIKNLLREGVITNEGEKVFPRDGKRFFNALSLNFRNPYLYAKERE